MKRVLLLTALMTVLLGAGAATAIATPSGASGHKSANAGPVVGSLKVNYKINQFVKKGNQLLAQGVVTATYTAEDGKTHSVKKPFSAHANVAKKMIGMSQTSRQQLCPVLTLQLDQLSLNLLGLHVDLSKVVLTITADSQGGILGRLFCSVANGKVKLATKMSAQRFTKAAHKSGLSTKGITVGVPTRQGSAAAPGPCQVVDLLLGPLHVDLLGLIVDLNQVHLQITADPNGGILGSLLCSITNQPTTTGTTT
jgi:hypothetical protein